MADLDADPLGPPLTTPHTSPSLQSAVDEATRVQPPDLNLAQSHQPSSRDDARHRSTVGARVLSDNEFPPPPGWPEYIAPITDAEPSDAATLAKTEAPMQANALPRDNQREDAVTALQPRPATAAENSAAASIPEPRPEMEDTEPTSLALVTDVIGIPTYNRTLRSQWSTLEQRVYDRVHQSHSRTKSPHSAHKSRAAFAAAGQIWALGEPEVKRRLEASEVGCLAGRAELLKLAKLPEINTERLTVNYTDNWLHAVDVAAREVLQHTLEQHETGGPSSGGQAKMRSPSAAPSTTKPLESPPTARSARRQNSAMKRSSAMVSFEALSLSASSNESSPRSGALSSNHKDENAAIASTESDNDEAEGLHLKTDRNPKESSGARKKKLKVREQPQLPVPAVSSTAEKIRTAVVTTATAAVRTVPPARTSLDPVSTSQAKPSPALRHQARTYDGLQKHISEIGKGGNGPDPTSHNALLLKVASALQQLAEEAQQIKTELETAVRRQKATDVENVALRSRVSKLEEQVRTTMAGVVMGVNPSPNPYSIEAIVGDGHCFFSGVEAGKGWPRGEAKARITQFLLAPDGLSNSELRDMGCCANSIPEDAIETTKHVYISKLLNPHYRGGELEAHLLAREQRGQLRIVFINTLPSPDPTKPIYPHRSFQVESGCPVEELILYWTRHGGTAQDAKPDHFDQVVERAKDGKVQRTWALNAKDADADAKALNRWQQARECCLQWDRQRSAKHTPALKTSVGASQSQAAAGGVSSSSMTYAAKAALGHNMPIATSSATTAVPPPENAWSKAPSRKSKQNKSSPRLVILNLPDEVSGDMIKSRAARHGLSFHNVTQTEVKANARPNSFRAVLHMKTDEQARELLQLHSAAEKVTGWSMRMYEPPMMRDQREATAPRDQALARQFFVAPAQSAVTLSAWSSRQLCYYSASEAECSRPLCGFVHKPGAHLRRRWHTDAPRAAAAAAQRE